MPNVKHENNAVRIESAAECPAFMLTEKTAVELNGLLLALQSGGYAPVTLHALFRERRGIEPLPPRSCAIILYSISERTLTALLPLLDSFAFPISLVCSEPYSSKTYVQLSSRPYLVLLAERAFLSHTPPHLLPVGLERKTAVYCDRVAAEILVGLRKSGVRMVLTAREFSREQLPSGIDILRVIELTHGQTFDSLMATARQHTCGGVHSFFLPLDLSVLFSDLSLAIPLSILGAKCADLRHVFASASWATCYSVSEDRYTVSAAFSELSEQAVSLPQDSVAGIRALLEQGKYVCLQTEPFAVSPKIAADRFLLFGCDDSFGTFAAMSAPSQGTYGRMDLRPETLRLICSHAAVTVLSADGAEVPFTFETFRERMRMYTERTDGIGDIFYGQTAAVRYVNHFCKRLSDGQERFRAASVRAFLEERRLFGGLMPFLAETLDLYIAPLETHCRLLETETAKALERLRGQEFLTADASLILLGDLMRKLLVSEDACRSAFAEEVPRAVQRAAYLREKRQLREKNG